MSGFGPSGFLHRRGLENAEIQIFASALCLPRISADLGIADALRMSNDNRMPLINYFEHPGGLFHTSGGLPEDLIEQISVVGKELAIHLKREARLLRIPLSDIELMRSSRLHVIESDGMIQYYFIDMGGDNHISYQKVQGKIDRTRVLEALESQIGNVVYDWSHSTNADVNGLVNVQSKHVQIYLKEMIRFRATRQIEHPPEIFSGIESFRRDFPVGQKTAFVVMSFQITPAHEAIVATLKKVLADHNIIALRADDKEYTDNLYGNILTYMHACDFGIAVFERITSNDFNPNVSLEVGYLMGMGKKVLLLKDKTLPSLPADLVGKLYKPFDPQNISGTLPAQVEKWLKDKELILSLNTGIVPA